MIRGRAGWAKERMIESSKSAVCVSKAARGDGCERFVNSAKQSAALMFTRVTRAAAGQARAHHVYMHTHAPEPLQYAHRCTRMRKIVHMSSLSGRYARKCRQMH